MDCATQYWTQYYYFYLGNVPQHFMRPNLPIPVTLNTVKCDYRDSLFSIRTHWIPWWHFVLKCWTGLIVSSGAKPWQPSLLARWLCGPVTGEQGSGSKGKQLLSSIWCTEVGLGQVKGQACQPLWGSAAMCLPYRWRAHVSAAGNALALSCVSLSSCLSLFC